MSMVSPGARLTFLRNSTASRRSKLPTEEPNQRIEVVFFCSGMEANDEGDEEALVSDPPELRTSEGELLSSLVLLAGLPCSESRSSLRCASPSQ
jgi:hypothetical protein